MADPFVAEIRIFSFNFPPTGWAFCNGQILPLSQNTALFSLLGTVYGGDGKSSFGLPDLQGRAPMQPGQGSGLMLHDLGETGGSDTVTLLQSEIPQHTHAVQAQPNPGNVKVPSAAVTLARSAGGSVYTTATSPLTAMSSQAVSAVGGDQPHNNLQPYLVLNYCIALQGVFPPRP